MERTLVLIKPDGVQRGLIGEITGRLERRGLRLVAARFCLVGRELAERHYAVHHGKPFYAGLVKYITSAPVMAMVWEGPAAVLAVRQTMGSTRPTEAAPGTIRSSAWGNLSANSRATLMEKNESRVPCSTMVGTVISLSLARTSNPVMA